MPESPLPKNLSNSSGTPRRSVSSDMSHDAQLEHEKRARREIANSNERRRMQSINTGFQSLKILIPHSCGEKLSKACILQRAADHIKALENEKLKLQSQNEQFRILIKSFQIDSSSVLQAQRQDETVVWQTPTSTNVDKLYRTVPTTTTTTPTSDSTFMIVKPNPRTYKANSIDQSNDHGLLLVERCQLRTQSVDTIPSGAGSSRPNLQTIFEAIRHLEGDDVLANISSNSSGRSQEDLPAQIKALINEKFPQTNNKNGSTNSGTTLTHQIDLHQRPPKKRKITFNEDDEPSIERHGSSEFVPIASPDVHHHEQVSSEPSTSNVAQLIQDDFIERRNLNY